jgi:predicted N-acetyltransferase YhbS
LDTARFGVSSARADDITLAEVSAILSFCDQENIQFLIARCETKDLAVVQALEAQGFLLMDTMVHHIYDIRRNGLPPLESPVPIRPFQPADRDAVLTIAKAAFEGYMGHYHADPRIDQAIADEIYADWARRETENSQVFVADQDGEVVGFITARMNTPQDGQIVLGGVSHTARGGGIYREFLKHCIHWLNDQGAERVLFVTQITNAPVQRVWGRLGCVLQRSEYTLHKWFDR